MSDRGLWFWNMLVSMTCLPVWLPSVHGTACCVIVTVWWHYLFVDICTAHCYCLFTGDLVSKAAARVRIEEYEKDEIDSLYLLHLRYVSSKIARAQLN